MTNEAESRIDTTGVKYITDDELALWHSQIPNHKKATQVMQTRLMMNWCEDKCGGPEQGDPETLRKIQLVRKGVLDQLKLWVSIQSRGRADVVQITTGRPNVQKLDLAEHVPGRETTVVNVNPQQPNGAKPGLFRRATGGRLR